MEFSLSGSEGAAADSRLIKQCRPVSELGDDHHHQPAMKLARTEPSFSGRPQELNSSAAGDDQSGYEMNLSAIYHQQQQQQQQQLRSHMSYSSPGHFVPIKQQHFTPAPGAQFQASYYPFTASQWAELEHQALIFKYMMARAPVPPELVNPFRRSLILSPNNSSFQLGVSTGSPMDAEPGRCRRTDGKKWRCSRPIVADQKYCERHIHRGRNRSRKAAEAAAAAAAAASVQGNNNNSNNSGANLSGSAAAASVHQSDLSLVQSQMKSGGAAANAGFDQSSKSNSNSSSNNTSNSNKFFLDQSVGGYQIQEQLHGKDHQRFVNGMSKAQFDLRPEQLLFSEVSGSCTRQQQLRGGDMADPTGGMRPPLHGHMYGCDPLLEGAVGEPLIRGGIQRQPERHFFVDWHDEDSKEGVLKLALEKSVVENDDADDDPYTSISLARISSGGDLLADVIKSPSSCGLKPPASSGFKLAGGSSVATSIGTQQQQQQQMILASPTGVLQKVTCFSDSSSSASSPGSVKNEASHAH